MGNTVLAWGLIAAARQSGKRLFLGAYPITPASDILHELARYKNFDVLTFQAEDEIAAMTATIGAAFAGAMAVTASQRPRHRAQGRRHGPGGDDRAADDHHQRAARRPVDRPADQDRAGRLVPSDVRPQRRMPDAGDRRQRPGRLLRRRPGSLADRRAVHDAGHAAHRRLHRQRLRALADSGRQHDLPKIEVKHPGPLQNGDTFLPYKRDERLARPWALPGTPGLEHRIGGLEKQDITGNVSYDPANHEHMVHTRAQKVANIAKDYPAAKARRPRHRRPARPELGRHLRRLCHGRATTCKPWAKP